MKDIPLRSNLIYEAQVKECLELKESFEGIKDEAFLSLWLNIPENIHREYMHASLIGSFKRMFCYPLISTNHTKPFYIGLGKYTGLIDKRLLNVKLPPGHSRAT